MYVCICNAVSETDIRRAAAEGVRSLEQLRMRTGCGTTCGCCEPVAEQVLAECLGESRRAPRHGANVITLRTASASR